MTVMLALFVSKTAYPKVVKATGRWHLAWLPSACSTVGLAPTLAAPATQASWPQRPMSPMPVFVATTTTAVPAARPAGWSATARAKTAGSILAAVPAVRTSGMSTALSIWPWLGWRVHIVGPVQPLYFFAKALLFISPGFYSCSALWMRLQPNMCWLRRLPVPAAAVRHNTVLLLRDHACFPHGVLINLSLAQFPPPPPTHRALSSADGRVNIERCSISVVVGSHPL